MKNEIITFYRLPLFGVFSILCLLLMWISLPITLLLWFFTDIFISIPFYFCLLLFSFSYVLGYGKYFSTSNFLKSINKNEITIPTYISGVIFFLITPLFVTFFLEDKNMETNTIYRETFYILYLFMFLYSSLLIWYLKNHKYHVR